MGIHKSLPFIVVMSFASLSLPGSAAAQDCPPPERGEQVDAVQPFTVVEPPTVVGAQASTVTAAQPSIVIAGRPGTATRDRGQATAARNANRSRARIASFDANGDGVVTRSEFRGSPLAFAALDRNRDGVLTGAERARESRER